MQRGSSADGAAGDRGAHSYDADLGAPPAPPHAAVPPPLRPATAADAAFAADAAELLTPPSLRGDGARARAVAVPVLSGRPSDASAVPAAPMCAPPPASASAPVQQRNWNEEFQALLEQSLLGSAEREVERTAALRRLARDFAEEACRVGVRIVEELHLPADAKTIRPARELPGVAGGEKFVHGGIFYKLAIDQYGIYGGDHNAMKAAGHELKGLMGLLDCRVAELHLPLCALVGYRGFTVIAESLLPIDGAKTLRYGSADGGRTLCGPDVDPALGEKLRVVARILNIKPHMVTSRHGGTPPALMYGPADMECHLGSDGRYYVLDVARLLPPRTPSPADRGSFLFNLFRQEFLQRNKVPLSSDCFSRFGRDSADVHNAEAREATRRLEQEVIPQFSRFLALLEEAPEAPQLIADLHLRGANVRYLALVASTVPQHAPAFPVLICEMLARAVKQALVHARWRALVTDNQLLGATPAEAQRRYCAVACECFDQVFGRGPLSTRFWETEAPRLLRKKFPLPDGHPWGWFAADRILAVRDVRMLFRRLLEISGVSVEPAAAEAVFGASGVGAGAGAAPAGAVDDDGAAVFRPEMFSLRPRVKHLHRISFEEGTALSRLAQTKETPAEALPCYEAATQKYRECLSIRPNDHRALFNWALALSKMAALKWQEGERDVADLLWKESDERHARAVLLDPTDHNAPFRWGNDFLERARAKQASHPHLVRPLLERACGKLNQAFALEPDDYQILCNAATAHLMLSKEIAGIERPETVLSLLEVAEARLEKAVRLRPGRPDSLWNLAVAKAKVARLVPADRRGALFAAASELYRAALEHTSEEEGIRRSELLFDWGNALYRQGCPAEAAAKYRDAFRADNRFSFSAALVNWGLALQQLPRRADFTAAVPEFAEALQCFLGCAPTKPVLASIPDRILARCAGRVLEEAGTIALAGSAGAGGAAPGVPGAALADFEVLGVWRLRTCSILRVRHAKARTVHLLQALPVGLPALDAMLRPVASPFHLPLHASFREAGHTFLVFGEQKAAARLSNLASVLRAAGRSLPQREADLLAAEMLAALLDATRAGCFPARVEPAHCWVSSKGHITIVNTYCVPDVFRAYVPPEVLAGHCFGEKGVVWCFGCFLFELYVRRVPFAAGGVHEMLRSASEARLDVPRESVGPDFRNLIHEALARDPDARPPLAALREHRAFAAQDWERVSQRRSRLPFLSQLLRDGVDDPAFERVGAARALPELLGSVVEQLPIDTFLAPHELNDFGGFTIVDPDSLVGTA